MVPQKFIFFMIGANKGFVLSFLVSVSSSSLIFKNTSPKAEGWRKKYDFMEQVMSTIFPQLKPLKIGTYEFKKIYWTSQKDNDETFYSHCPDIWTAETEVTGCLKKPFSENPTRKYLWNGQIFLKKDWFKSIENNTYL